jgi:hypothetical protein
MARRVKDGLDLDAEDDLIGWDGAEPPDLMELLRATREHLGADGLREAIAAAGRIVAERWPEVEALAAEVLASWNPRWFHEHGDGAWVVLAQIEYKCQRCGALDPPVLKIVRRGERAIYVCPGCADEAPCA